MKRFLAAVSMSVLAAASFAQSGGMKGMEMKEMPMMNSDGKTGETHKGKGTVKSVDAKKGTVSLDQPHTQAGLTLSVLVALVVRLRAKREAGLFALTASHAEGDDDLGVLGDVEGHLATQLVAASGQVHGCFVLA